MSHLSALAAALIRFAGWEGTLSRLGRELADAFDRGGRLLACGNGGSAAEAQHLTAELTGRFETERRPLPAIPLHADTSATTAIGNDYHFRDIFARQVMAHGRPGDVLVCLSTSGRSPNVLAAARTARRRGLACWALTGPAPNPLAAECAETVAVEASEATTVQELHLVAIHMICAAVERAIAAPEREEAQVWPRLSLSSGTSSWTSTRRAPASGCAPTRRPRSSIAARNGRGPAVPGSPPCSRRRTARGPS